jgi:hypothetical protein
MKRATAVWASAGAIALSSFSNSAFADVTPSPAPTSQADSFKVLMEQFKRDREEFNVALRERFQKMRLINQTFDTAIRKARQDSKLALKPEQKSAINSALKSVIAAAVIAREEAIEALGEAPIPPTEPTKGPKAMHSDKNGSEKKRR